MPDVELLLLSPHPESPGVEHATYGLTGWESEHGNLYHSPVAETG